MQRTAAIVGAGLTEVGKVYGRTAQSLAAEAVRLALADAGLALSDVDGLLINAGKSSGLDLTLARHLGLRDLRSRHRCRGVRAGCAENGRSDPGRHRRARDLRLLHLYRSRHPRGLRVLRQG
jgi:acetyl-CoA acetyltransferase